MLGTPVLGVFIPFCSEDPPKLIQVEWAAPLLGFFQDSP
jgi:hypothetical protein